MLPTSPPPIRACLTDLELRERDRARPRLRPALPPPVVEVGRIAVALCEVEAGARPRHQLERVCHPTLWEVLAWHLTTSGPAVTSRSLRRVLAQERSPGIVDGVAVVDRGGRVEPVAMRLDAAAGHWEVVELQYVPAGGDLDAGQRLAGRTWASAVLPRAVPPLGCRFCHSALCSSERPPSLQGRLIILRAASRCGRQPPAQARPVTPVALGTPVAFPGTGR